MMFNPPSKLFIAAIFIYILTISAAFADRILIDDPQQTVTVSNHFSCYRPVDITVDTANPGLYDDSSSELQKLSDSVKAMLSYECPGLSSIRLTGLIRGLDEIVYQGEMLKNNSWLVKPLSSTSSDDGSNQTSSLFSTQPGVAKRYDDELKLGELDITGLHLGMTVPQVSELVTKTFALAPHYDAEKGVMTMTSGDCPAEFGPADEQSGIMTDSKCLQAWFSDNRVARLERVNLFQVVDGQVQQVNSLLVNKYGNPTQANSTADNTQSQMVWRAMNTDAENQSVIQEIDAIIKMIDDDYVSTNVTLYSTQPENSHDERYADLGLNL